ncbi:MAG: AEC family transporter [Geminicoccaceae bacterium]|nr:AEC family transporter [Geminicoccaceae bacterium]MCS7267426.1 AEC family transporter [Geminicoccaceae bacterium]MDW8125664.1 AEC family transporter [Geminicoccaceae bacterium]MDW8342282.1 AEC family transporter [Geminicoccaceae bacterium]
MRVILDVVVPFFAVIFCGWAAFRLGAVDATTAKGLNAFVYWFALPALLVLKVSAAPIARLFDPGFLVIYFGPAMIIYFTILDYGRLVRREDDATAALRALGATFPNSGYMGIPLLIAAFGPEAAIASILALLLDQFVSIPLTVALVEAGGGRGGFLATLGRTLRGVFTNPLVLAVLAGALLALAGWRLPGPVQGVAELLGAAASPCALFALGTALAAVPVAGAVSEVVLVSAVRLLGHPLLVWFAANFVHPVPPEVLRAALVTAALPTAATVFVMAQRAERFPASSTIVLVTHAVSILTLSVLLVWLS